jgi:hypothetical protein
MAEDPFAPFQTPKENSVNDPFAAFQSPKAPATLPDVTNKDLGRAGKAALGSLPWIGAGIGSLMAPEIAGGGWLVNAAIGAGYAAAGGAAGSAVEQGAKAIAGTRDRPRSAGEFAKRVGAEAAVQGAGEFGGRALAVPFSFVLKKFSPYALYGGALKPSTALKVAERNRIIQTGLKGIPTSDTGYSSLMKAVEQTSHQINQEIAKKSPQFGHVIDPNNVLDRLDAMIEHYEKQAYPNEDIQTIKKVRDSFAKRHSYEAPYTEIAPNRPGSLSRIDAAGKPVGAYVPVKEKATTVMKPLTLAEAQAEKQGTYRFNKPGYGSLGGAQLEAEKNMAHTLREQITAIFPEVEGLNRHDRSLIELEEQLRKFVGRQGNKNMIGLVPAVAAAGTGLFGGLMSDNKKTGAESGAVGGVLAFAVMALDDPEIKSKLAITLAKAAKSRLSGIASGVAKHALPAATRAIGSAANSDRVSTPPSVDEVRRQRQDQQ